jgi:hypothetical protein
MVEQIERQVGIWPLYSTMYTSGHVLFPRGRSDKVYLILFGGYDFIRGSGRAERTWEDDMAQLVCYQSGGKHVTFLYSVRLRDAKKPPKQGIPVNTLLDYVSTLGGVWQLSSDGREWEEPHSYVPSGRISEEAQRDLRAKQELVRYSFTTIVERLYVSCLSPKEAKARPEEGYDFDKQWAETYGLPVACCELTAKDRQGSKQK